MRGNIIRGVILALGVSVMNSGPIFAADKDGCWSGKYSGGSCLTYTSFVDGKNRRTVMDLTNQCSERLYVRWCVGSRCGADGIRPGDTERKYEFVTNSNPRVWAVGSNKPSYDYVCRSRLKAW